MAIKLSQALTMNQDEFERSCLMASPELIDTYGNDLKNYKKH